MKHFITVIAIVGLLFGMCSFVSADCANPIGQKFVSSDGVCTEQIVIQFWAPRPSGSPGPPDVCNDGTVVVTQDGMVNEYKYSWDAETCVATVYCDMSYDPDGVVFYLLVDSDMITVSYVPFFKRVYE